MKQIIYITIYIIGGVAFSISGLAAPIELAKTTNKVEFLAVGTPSAIKIRGKVADKSALSGTLKVEGNTLGGNAIVKLDALDTGIKLRDEHMKEKYLETTKHPTATLKISDTALNGDTTKDGFSYKGPFKGSMTLHGTEKPVEGTLEVKRENGKLDGNFAFSLELSDYGIDIPSYMGIKVSKTVTVEAAFKE